MEQPWDDVPLRLPPQKQLNMPDCIQSEGAQAFKLKNDIIESWIMSHEPWQSSLDEQSVSRTDAAIHPITFTKQIASGRAMTVRSDGFGKRFATEQPCDMSTGAKSQSISHQPFIFPSCRTPGYPEFARQDMAATMPWRFQTDAPTSHPRRTRNCTQPTVDSEAENQVPFLDYRSPCAWRGFDQNNEAPERAILHYGSSVSGSEDNVHRDEAFDEGYSVTTPVIVPSYYSSDSYFALSNSSMVGSSACVASELHNRWSLDPDGNQLSIEPSAESVSNNHERPMNPHGRNNGAVLNCGPDQSNRIENIRPLDRVSPTLPRRGTINTVEEALHVGISLTTARLCPLQLTRDIGSLSDGSMEYLRPQSPQRSRSDEQRSPRRRPDCATAPSTTSLGFANLEDQAQTNGQVTSHAMTLLSKKFPGHSVETISRRCLPGRGSRKDEILVRLRQAGISYKDIKATGQFTEAESTLRGRFRTLTKKKEQRVRKPQWRKEDLGLLEQAVIQATLGNLDRASPPSSTSPSGIHGGLKTSRIPWKQVSEYIANHGGSYRFGNATCRKKWDELNEECSTSLETAVC